MVEPALEAGEIFLSWIKDHPERKSECGASYSWLLGRTYQAAGMVAKSKLDAIQKWKCAAEWFEFSAEIRKTKGEESAARKLIAAANILKKKVSGFTAELASELSAYQSNADASSVISSGPVVVPTMEICGIFLLFLPILVALFFLLFLDKWN